MAAALGMPHLHLTNLRLEADIGSIAHLEVGAFATDREVGAIKAAFVAWADARKLEVTVNVQLPPRTWGLAEGEVDAAALVDAARVAQSASLRHCPHAIKAKGRDGQYHDVVQVPLEVWREIEALLGVSKTEGEGVSADG